MTKAPFISYFCISYFGHACPKLNLVLISLLTGKRATQNLKKTYAILVYEYADMMNISRSQNKKDYFELIVANKNSI